jgi:hypothetical protein
MAHPMILVFPYARGLLHESLQGQTLALVFMAVAAARRFYGQYRKTTAPLLPGASWNVGFSPGLRSMSVVVLAMLSPAMIPSRADAAAWALALLGCIGLWGGVMLATLPSFRRSTERLRALVAAGPGVRVRDL